MRGYRSVADRPAHSDHRGATVEIMMTCTSRDIYVCAICPVVECYELTDEMAR